jgi:hypothetical protein
MEGGQPNVMHVHGKSEICTAGRKDNNPTNYSVLTLRLRQSGLSSDLARDQLKAKVNIKGQ